MLPGNTASDSKQEAENQKDRLLPHPIDSNILPGSVPPTESSPKAAESKSSLETKPSSAEKTVPPDLISLDEHSVSSHRWDSLYANSIRILQASLLCGVGIGLSMYFVSGDHLSITSLGFAGTFLLIAYLATENHQTYRTYDKQFRLRTRMAAENPHELAALRIPRLHFTRIAWFGRLTNTVAMLVSTLKLFSAEETRHSVATGEWLATYAGVAALSSVVSLECNIRMRQAAERMPDPEPWPKREPGSFERPELIAKINGFLKLSGLVMGNAWQADSFFDAFAQGLHAANIRIPGDFTMDACKKLRLICNREFDQAFRRGAKHYKTLVKQMEDEKYDLDTSVGRVSYNYREAQLLKQFGFNADAARLPTRACASIEGKFLCQVLDICLYFVKLNSVGDHAEAFFIDAKACVPADKKDDARIHHPRTIRLLAYGDRYVPLTQIPGKQTEGLSSVPRK